MVGFHVSLVVVDRDGPFGDIEGVLAVGAVVVFPAAICLVEDVIDEGLDGLLHRPGLALDPGASPNCGGYLDLDLWQRDDIISGFGLDRLDLAAVAVAVEGYDD